jgi:hypothetical protein
VLLVHHTGKDAAKGARGWSGIRAHIDTEIEVVETNGERIATITKQRELPGKGDAFGFKLEIVEMGVSKFGETATTCVAVPAEVHEEPAKPKREPRVERHRKAFENAWWHAGAETRDGMPYVSRSALRSYLVENMGMTQSNAAQNVKPSAAPGKMVRDLLDAEHIVACENGYSTAPSIHATAMILRKSEP